MIQQFSSLIYRPQIHRLTIAETMNRDRLPPELRINFQIASRSLDWHLLMAAYSLVRLDPESSALGTVHSEASSLRVNLEHSLEEAVYNLLLWVRDNDDRGVDDLMEEIDYLLVHSTADANVQV